MPQRQKLTWVQLRLGVLVLFSLTILAVGIFFISGQVGFLTKRYTLTTYFPSAQELREGAEVDLAGIPIGNVTHIRITSVNDPNRAVEVMMKVTGKYMAEIRQDSVATIETQGLLGQSFVDISLGTPHASEVAPGGVIPGQVKSDVKQVVQNTNDVLENLRVLSAQLADITAQIEHGKGSIGELVYSDALYNRLNTTANSIQTVVAQVQKGQGTIGKLLTDDTLYNRLNSTINHLNQAVDTFQHGNGSLAKFMNDPALYNNLKQATDRANILMAKINSGKGTLGKLVNDPSLYNRMNATLDHVNVITERLDKGQGTLGQLSTNPSLYNNLNQSSISLREFLTEFRKNPRKYLTLHMRIF